MTQRTSTPGQFVDLLLFLIGGAFAALLLWVTGARLVEGDWRGTAPVGAFAALNGAISYSGFRRLRAAIKKDAESEVQNRRPRDWKGDPMS